MQEYIIPAAAAIIVAIIEAGAARDRKRVKCHEQKAAERAERREEEARLSMRMMDASLELGLATALAVENHRLNGEMTAARENAQEAQAAYRHFIERVAAKQLAKK